MTTSSPSRRLISASGGLELGRLTWITSPFSRSRSSNSNGCFCPVYKPFPALSGSFGRRWSPGSVTSSGLGTPSRSGSACRQPRFFSASTTSPTPPVPFSVPLLRRRPYSQSMAWGVDNRQPWEGQGDGYQAALRNSLPPLSGAPL